MRIAPDNPGVDQAHFTEITVEATHTHTVLTEGNPVSPANYVNTSIETPTSGLRSVAPLRCEMDGNSIQRSVFEIGTARGGRRWVGLLSL